MFIQVGPPSELAKAKHKFSSHRDPTINQPFMSDWVINPQVGTHQGVKCTSWSPLGCDASGRCLLALLSLDHRLTVHQSVKRLEWSTVADLTALYSQRLVACNYAHKKVDDSPPPPDPSPCPASDPDTAPAPDPAPTTAETLLNLEELRRRYRMQTPLRMEWSGVYTMKQLAADHACCKVEMVLLAVLMENGDLVLWRFDLPFGPGAEPAVYDVIPSDVADPTGMAWWEYNVGDRRMSGLIVGREAGPVKIMPVAMAGIKGYFTLRKPVVLWPEEDRIPVENIRCVPLYHPAHRTECSLVVASRGCYVFWCLLMISPAGLSVHNAHVAGVHSLPIVALEASRRGGEGGGVAVYTCSLDGRVKRLVPRFTGDTMEFCQEEVLPPDTLPGRRILSIAVSANGAYLALANTQGMVGGHHPVERSYQVNFVSLKTAQAAGALLLDPSPPPTQSLYQRADLLDLLRWAVLRDKAAPPGLMAELDQKISTSDSAYFRRFKLFLLRMLTLALRKVPSDPRWRLTSKAIVVDGAQAGEGEEEEQEMEVVEEDMEDGRTEQQVKQEEEAGRSLAEAQAEMKAVEEQLIRGHMKKVLGDVYLNIWSAVNTSIPTCGLVDYLSVEPGDRAAEVSLPAEASLTGSTSVLNCMLSCLLQDGRIA